MSSPREVGRYLLHDAIASGGMARVHVGRVVGPAGFSRIVAIKRLHPHLAGDPKFAAMFVDEARLASRIHHPNVIGTLDVVVEDDQLFLVMDFVRGESLAQLLAQGPPPSVGMAVAIVIHTLQGLHAAHEATDEAQRPLDIVHRDVSPQNVLVGLDGIARVVDFGIAKAAIRVQQTEDGELKGKLAYMAPEQLRRAPTDRRTDIYGAAVMLWEALAQKRLFAADSPAGVLAAVLDAPVVPPSMSNPEVGPELDAIVQRGLARDPNVRFATALEMAEALAHAVAPASPREVSAWVEVAGGDALRQRLQRVADLERGRGMSDPATIAGVLTGTERRRIVEAPTGPVEPRGASHADMLASEAARKEATWPGVEPYAEPSASTTTGRSSRARPIMAAILLAAVTAGAGGFALASARLGRNTTETARSVSQASHAIASGPSGAATSTPSAIPARDGPLALPKPGLSTTESSIVAPTAGASTSASTPSGRATPHRALGHRTSTSAPKKGVTATPSCDPLYTIDENGIKRFKRWCAAP